MAQEAEKLPRNWQDIAADAAKETDPEKLRKLTEELGHVLDKRDGSFSEEKSASASSSIRIKAIVSKTFN
jgi:hypothetical protein